MQSYFEFRFFNLKKMIFNIRKSCQLNTNSDSSYTYIPLNLLYNPNQSEYFFLANSKTQWSRIYLQLEAFKTKST